MKFRCWELSETAKTAETANGCDRNESLLLCEDHPLDDLGRHGDALLLGATPLVVLPREEVPLQVQELRPAKKKTQIVDVGALQCAGRLVMGLLRLAVGQDEAEVVGERYLQVGGWSRAAGNAFKRNGDKRHRYFCI